MHCVTALTCDGLIVVFSLPRPLGAWLASCIADQELFGTWDPDEGYIVGLEDMLTLLIAAEIPGANTGPH